MAKTHPQSCRENSSSMMSLSNKKRIILVGDKCCGKTCLAVCASQELFLDYHHLSDGVQDFEADIPCGESWYSVTILDTTEDSFSRSLAYKCCDVVVVCFDLTDSGTLESVESKWLPELEENCPGVPFILAGCKRDEMCDGPAGCKCTGGACCDLSEEYLKTLLSRTGSNAYIDCSALKGENTQEVFRLARQSVTVRRSRNSAKKLFASLKSKSKFLKKRLSLSSSYEES